MFGFKKRHEKEHDLLTRLVNNSGEIAEALTTLTAVLIRLEFQVLANLVTAEVDETTEVEVEEDEDVNASGDGSVLNMDSDN